MTPSHTRLKRYTAIATWRVLKHNRAQLFFYSRIHFGGKLMSSHKIPSPNHTPYRILIDRSSRRCTEEFGRTARGHDLGPLGAPKKRATTRPGAHEKRTTRSTARSSRRQPAISPGALIPTLCKEKDAAPSESGTPTSDPRVIRSERMQNLIGAQANRGVI